MTNCSQWCVNGRLDKRKQMNGESSSSFKGDLVGAIHTEFTRIFHGKHWFTITKDN